MTTAFQSGAFQGDSFQIDAAGGGNTGIIAATQADNTAALSGTETFSGAISATQASNTATLTGSVIGNDRTGTINATQDGNTASLTGLETFSGAIAGTQADNTASVSGNVTGGSISGSIAVVQDANTSALSGAVANPVTGVITAQQDDNTALLYGTGGEQLGAGTNKRKKFQVETTRGVIEVETLEEVASIMRKAKALPKSKPVVATLEGVSVKPSLKKGVDYAAIEAKFRAEIEAEMDDEEILMLLL